VYGSLGENISIKGIGITDMVKRREGWDCGCEGGRCELIF
jgi:hypothetical protein